MKIHEDQPFSNDWSHLKCGWPYVFCWVLSRFVGLMGCEQCLDWDSHSSKILLMKILQTVLCRDFQRMPVHDKLLTLAEAEWHQWTALTNWTYVCFKDIPKRGGSSSQVARESTCLSYLPISTLRTVYAYVLCGRTFVTNVTCVWLNCGITGGRATVYSQKSVTTEMVWELRMYT